MTIGYDACGPDDDDYSAYFERERDNILADNDDIDDFVGVMGHELPDLLRLVIERGLPRNDESEQDDMLRDTYEVVIDSICNRFADWLEGEIGRRWDRALKAERTSA